MTCKCNQRMDHPELNVYVCPECGFSYEIEPSTGKIRILNIGGKKNE